MFSSNQNVHYPLHPVFREYTAKFMNRCIQSANDRKLELLITNGSVKNTDYSNDDNSQYSSKFVGGLIFLSISTGIYLFFSGKK